MSRREQSMVPEAEFGSYYGRPILKEPTWKVPDVPGYLFLGGLAGSSASLAAMAALTGRPALARAGRLAAAASAAGSVGALVHDLGRPERFLNMLRVIKPTSPLSVGSWILAPFGVLSGLSAASEVTGMLPAAGRPAGLGAGLLGPALSTYTAVLLADTAVPSWHAAYPELPFLFAGSALTSGGALGMITTPAAQAGPARRAALAGAALELAAAQRIEHRLGLAGEPYRNGRAGSLLRTGRALTLAGAVLAVTSRLRAAQGGRAAALLGGTAMLAAGLCTRFGVFAAGVTSARDPKYTVMLQRAQADGRRQTA
jgi:Polysulphide reductase, NrfD